jgi:hypothetical protein
MHLTVRMVNRLLTPNCQATKERRGWRSYAQRSNTLSLQTRCAYWIKMFWTIKRANTDAQAAHMALWQHPTWSDFDGFWINDERTLIYFSGWQVTRR